MSDVKQPAATRRASVPVVPIVLVLLAVGAYFGYQRFLAPTPLPSDVIVMTGRIEGDDSAVSAKAPGRILEITVREGDSVEAGAILARIDDEQIRAREQQAQSAVDQAGAQLNAARQQVAILAEQLRATGLETGQVRRQSQGQILQAEAELAAAEAALAQQEAAHKLALFDRDAYTKLAKSGAVSERQGRQAEVGADTQAALVNASRRRVESAKAALSAARASEVNPELATSQGAVIRQQIAQQQAQIAAMEAQAAQARARLTEAQANRRDLEVRAPFAGTVTTRAAEPGEVVNAGTPLLTLVDLTKVYLRGFVPEGQIGRIRVGQPARVFLDSAPDTPLDAIVSRVDPQATFTPENTYFREDRVKQVVGVKLQIRATPGFAKPGMPADGEVLVEGAQWRSAKRTVRK